MPRVTQTSQNLLAAQHKSYNSPDLVDLNSGLPLTEPLSQHELARLFNCHRNQVVKLVLMEYPHQVIGRKYRLPVKYMPPDYFLESKPWSDSNVKKRKEMS